MDMDLGATARALEFLGIVADNLVTLHAAFLLAFVVGAVALRHARRGPWDGAWYAGFAAGLTGVLLLGIVFLGLRFDLSERALFLLGLTSAAVAWLVASAQSPQERRSFARAISRPATAISSRLAWMGQTRVPDRLPPELRSLGARRR